MKARYPGLVILIGVSFLAGTIVPTAKPQPAMTRYLQVDYMKVEPGKVPEYLSLEQDLWKPIHQARVKDGTLKAWSLYGVQFPSGTDEKYNFVTLNVFDQFQGLEAPLSGFEELVAKAHPDTKISDFSNRTNSARRLVRSEVWSLIDHVE